MVSLLFLMLMAQERVYVPPIYLVQAATEGNVELVKRLLEQGADVNGKIEQNGGTPLMAAAGKGHYEIVDILLAVGAEVDLATKDDGLTALVMASVGGHHQVASKLLQYGAKVDLPASNGGTPLMFAAENGHTKTVAVLLKAGANPNAQIRGLTVMALAKRNNNEELLKLLEDAIASQTN